MSERQPAFGRYIGTKIVDAVPMWRGDYNNLRGWVTPEGEDPTDAGYLVEYLDGGKPNHPGFSGYISWSPKAVFERAYHLLEAGHTECPPSSTYPLGRCPVDELPLAQKLAEQLSMRTDNLKFGVAIEAMKLGLKVTRKGWNGKGMFLFLVPGSTFQVSRNPLAAIYPMGTEINYRPHVDMKTVDGQIVPWVCSQSDLLATDWEVVA